MVVLLAHTHFHLTFEKPNLLVHAPFARTVVERYARPRRKLNLYDPQRLETFLLGLRDDGPS
jgi:hypothetical protein